MTHAIKNLPQFRGASATLPAWHDIAGLTLTQYAQRQGIKPGAARSDYRRLMRGQLESPGISRMEQSDESIKFCIPVASAPQYETESVLIPMRSFHGGRWFTLCVSSQVGCRMGCTFCQTARMGLVKSLWPAEIVGQLLTARKVLQGTDAESNAAHVGVRNIVFMGMGEPLDNLDSILAAIATMTDPAGLAMPMGRITISTVGRIDGIRKLSAARLEGVKLAVSLNAPNDDLRSAIMPVNRAMPLAALHEALVEYSAGGRRKIFLEYVLLAGVNDSHEHAAELVHWCRALNVVVNVIPYNPQQPAAYQPPDEATVVRFVAAIKSLGILAKRRITHGRDLMAACGQLGNPAVSRKRGQEVLGQSPLLEGGRVAE
ncbi:MAG: 23S rRNA (adenine(2503)-C(2))-methyltransferase RlmN [Phycisphaerales bacterium]|nr:23S rRNA (adenine(2503)-C(2))-methyltransferase RlmN [Phycisphaerales bacterium]